MIVSIERLLICISTYHCKKSLNFRYHRPPYNIRWEEPDTYPSQRRPSKSEDEFEGIMTQKEKDWIVKIQLMQLQTDNPYLHDYYYTVSLLLDKYQKS